MSETVSQLPPFKQPILDGTGLMTLPWRRFFESQWKRTGGFTDDVWAALIYSLTASTQVSQILGQISAIEDQFASVRAEFASRGNYDDDIKELRVKIAVAQQSFDSLMQQQEVTRQDQTRQIATAEALGLTYAATRAADTAGFSTDITNVNDRVTDLTTADVAEVTNLYFTTGRVTAVVSGTYATIASISTVGFSGAYADLTGTPTLGTAAAVNTGTSGATVPLLNGTNTWANRQTFSGGVAFGTNTVAVLVQTGWVDAQDAAGNPIKLLTG